MKCNKELKSTLTVKDTRSVQQKQSSLQRLGIKISIKNNEDDYSDGYILGRMKDKYRDKELVY
jgi:hypothetical protein